MTTEKRIDPRDLTEIKLSFREKANSIPFPFTIYYPQAERKLLHPVSAGATKLWHLLKTYMYHGNFLNVTDEVLRVDSGLLQNRLHSFLKELYEHGMIQRRLDQRIYLTPKIILTGGGDHYKELCDDWETARLTGQDWVRKNDPKSRLHRRVSGRL